MNHVQCRLPGFTCFFYLSCLAAGPVAAEPWNVKKFEIFVGRPNNSQFVLPGGVPAETFYSDEAETPTRALAPSVKADIEKYLAESAETLERWGFKPPVLEPIVENAAGEEVYRIYYYDFGGASPPARWRNDKCGKFRPTIALNGESFLDAGGQVKVKGYQELAHELFHGVQASYPLFKERCKDGPGGWINEGTAQFMGAEVAAWGPRAYNFPNVRKDAWVVFRWGVRPYDIPLYIEPQDSNAYGASSFWRYLGEYVALNGGAGTKMVQPDYRFLIDLLNSSLGGPPTQSSSMNWIDREMRRHKKIGLGLDRMFPLFINTFAAYGGTRIQPAGYGAKYSETWLKNVFMDSPCPLVTLDEVNPRDWLDLRVKPFAAACIGLEVNHAYDTDVHLYVTGPGKAAVQSLSAGIEQGKVVAQPIVLRNGSDWAASWIFTIPAGRRENVVFSNVFKEPGDTRAFKGRIEISATMSSNNMAVYGPPAPVYGPQPPPPGAQEGAPKAGGTKKPAPQQQGAGDTVSMQSQQARVAGQLESGMDSLNPNTAHGNTMARHADARPCRDPFESAACGPHLTIRMEMMPGTFGSLRTSTGRGGVFGQVTGMFSGLANTEMMYSSEKTRVALEQADGFDASRVTLKIPLIDYGFTGTFNNASIVASRKGGAGNWEAVDAAAMGPFSTQAPKLTGKVTIDEYTPSVLRGSFSGTLVFQEDSHSDSDNPPPIETEYISGKFQIVATWSADDRIAVIADDPGQIIDDLTLQTGIPVANDYEIIQVGDRQKVVPKQGSAASASGGSTSGGCSCECEMRGKVDDLCELFCEEEFAACDSR